MIFLYIFREEM